jgi:hypothetical protein
VIPQIIQVTPQITQASPQFTHVTPEITQVTPQGFEVRARFLVHGVTLPATLATRQVCHY